MSDGGKLGQTEDELDPSVASADYEPQNIAWNGYSEFIALAKNDESIEAVLFSNRLLYNELTPADSIVLVHPTRFLDVENLGKFLVAGGRVLLLDDFGRGDLLLKHFSMERKVFEFDSPSPLGFAFPMAFPVTEHPSLVGVSAVMLNHPSAISHSSLTSLLEVETKHLSHHMVAVSGAVGKGRFLAMSDPSAFINDMFQFEGNRQFAKGLIRYASEDDSYGLRHGKMYFTHDAFEEAGRFGPGGSDLMFGGVFYYIQDLKEEVTLRGLPREGLFGLALALVFALVFWAKIQFKRKPPERFPSYVRNHSPFEQGGVLGHAATLQSRFAGDRLTVSEWKSALDDELSLLLDLDPLPSRDELIEIFRAQKGFDSAQLSLAKDLFLSFSKMDDTWYGEARGKGSLEDEFRVTEMEEKVLKLLSFFSPKDPSSNVPISASRIHRS